MKFIVFLQGFPLKDSDICSKPKHCTDEKLKLIILDRNSRGRHGNISKYFCLYKWRSFPDVFPKWLFWNSINRNGDCYQKQTKRKNVTFQLKST